MIRRTAAALAVAATSLMAAGCIGTPDGVDGDLASGWASLPEPEIMVPEAGVCHNRDYSQVAELGLLYQPVDCDEPHRIETVHVGTFEGDADERSSPPGAGTSPWRETYQECDREAADYLGADFRHGWLWLGVAVPTDQAWDGGARWFRCDLVETVQEDGIPAALGSREGILTEEDSRLALGCYTVVSVETDGSEFGSIDEMEPVACDEPHQAEFVGVWERDSDRRPDSDADFAQLHAGCRERVAGYVDVPVDNDLPFRTGTIVDPVPEADWDNGDRKLRCYLWLADAELTESLAGAGTAGLPVR